MIVPTLSELSLAESYHKGRDDIAKSFYLPCMKLAIRYDRAVGFFSSTVFLIAWPSLKSFVGRGGHIRVICSPFLSHGDRAALEEGYDARLEEAIVKGFRDEIARMLSDTDLGRPTRVLAALVAADVIEVRIAFVSSNADGKAKGLFH